MSASPDARQELGDQRVGVGVPSPRLRLSLSPTGEGARLQRAVLELVESVRTDPGLSGSLWMQRDRWRQEIEAVATASNA